MPVSLRYVFCVFAFVVLHAASFAEGVAPKPLYSDAPTMPLPEHQSIISASTGPLVVENAGNGDFPLVTASTAAPVFYSEADAKVVAIAARDLAADIERVTGKRPEVVSNSKSEIPNSPAVIVGTLGKNAAIDALVASGKLDVSRLQGKWESFLIAVADDSLVIAGSDRRGTAYGVYELSQAIGVSPWYWWADVAPAKKSTLTIFRGVRHYGPPSVKYRGIFINDEDWGLQPWAAKTFEPESKGIGPKTYGKVFELLLRLKANTLWPAMHKCSPAFNSNPANAALADDYAIIMGSSHAEPMLRNNVSEWTAPATDYNYATNRDGVLAYWEERMKTNARYENIYTLGMRGIHDSGMQGGGSREEQITRLEKIFADQRALVSKYVSPDVERVPQMFCAYKEVLDLYRGGLRVPDDVTVMFPDDNFGYIRNFPGESERAAKRSGGYGIYYHLSYLGRPLAYLWLSTTPPALIHEEMRKAYDLGADRIWIANVGDIKPAEITTEFFLQMAWDVNRWNYGSENDFLKEWAAREFGGEYADDIAALMSTYFTYNLERRPEHLQWWLPGEKPRPSTLTQQDRERRRTLALGMNELLAKIRDRIPADKQDAFYELVDYPVQGSILANNRYFTGEEAALKYLDGDSAALEKLGYMGDIINGQLIRITHRFNNLIAGGKWRGVMQLEPADGDWKSMRLSTWRVPAFQTPLPSLPKEPMGSVTLQSAAAGWTTIEGLGRNGRAYAVTPATKSLIPLSRAKADAPQCVFQFTLPVKQADAVAVVHVIPAHAVDSSDRLRIAYAFDDVAAPQLAEIALGDGGAEWAQGVLSNERVFKIKIPDASLTAGSHTLILYGIDASVVIDRVTIE